MDTCRPAIDDADIERVYGRWVPRTPSDAAEMFADYEGTWWIAAGWAIEAFTGVARPHGDCDLSVLRDDFPLLLRHVEEHYDVWSAASGALRPVPRGWRGTTDDGLLDGSEQVWLRPSAIDPWEYDVMLSPGTPETWVYKRDRAITMPMNDALWFKDGIPYLKPEIQLLYKAKARRAKDEVDFGNSLPLLDQGRRRWLSDALARTLPGHPWQAQLP